MARNGNVVFRLSTRLALLGILVWHIPAQAYDCNIHLQRDNIYASTTDTSPISPALSFRDICFDVDANEDTTLGEWPICQCINTNRIVSNPNDPNNPNCPPGYLELGRCIKAKRYYEKNEGDINVLDPGDYLATVFRAFVPNPDLCEPCGHEVVSTVLGCQALCRRYFGNRFFMDGNAMTHFPGNQSQHDGGSWVIDDQNPDAMITNNPNNVPTLLDYRVCDENAPEEFPNCPTWTQQQKRDAGVPTTREICERRCGPPNFHNTDVDSLWNQPGDNWWAINYQHRDPNDRLDQWLRSYNNVPDRPDPPSKECEALVSAYCDYLADPAEPDNPDQLPYIDGIHKAQCKKNLVIRSRLAVDRGFNDPAPFVDYGPALYISGPTSGEGAVRTGDTFDFTNIDPDEPFAIPTDYQMSNDGFCDHLRRENNLCPQTCYVPEGHGAVNELHMCGNGLLEAKSGTASCVQAAVNGVTSRDGGAVCSIPPPQADDEDFQDKTVDVEFNKVALIAPPRPTTCGDPRIAVSGAATHAVTYDPAESTSAGGTDADGIRNEIAKATWRNLNQTDPTKASGRFTYVPAYYFGQTDTPVELVPGLNRIVYTFTDRHLRTSGEAIEMLYTPTTTTTLPPP
jgi:hypothetical protein